MSFEGLLVSLGDFSLGVVSLGEAASCFQDVTSFPVGQGTWLPEVPARAHGGSC